MKRDINNKNYLYFLGGFVEGEGSNSVSISVNRGFKYGVNIQPIFNVTQHISGIEILKSFGEVLNCGSIVSKSGTKDVKVFTIKGYKQILEHVIPFLYQYVQPFSCKKEEYRVFKQICIMSYDGKQKDKESLMEMVKLAYSVEGKGKGRKRTLNEVLHIIESSTKYKFLNF